MPTLDWEQRSRNVIRRIEESDVINERNKELILEYKRDKVLDGFSDATLNRNLNRLKILAEHLGNRSFDELERAEVKDLVEWLHEQDYTPGTVDTYKNVIRSFYRWLDPTDDGKTPPVAAWIRIGGAKGNGTLPKDLLTKSDVDAQIAAAHNPRDRALIAMLYETGARIGELIDLTVGDIEDRRHGKKVVIEGKTGARRLPLVECVPHLNRWLSEHPDPRKQTPLWCKVQQQGPSQRLDPTEVDDVEAVHGIGPALADRLRTAGIETGTDLVSRTVEEVATSASVNQSRAQGWLDQFDPHASFTPGELEPLGYRYVRDKILRRTLEDASIDKPSNPHHYRHSRASYLANHMTEAQLCAWFGWVQGSDVPARYVHLSGRDIDNAYDTLHGLYEPDEEEDHSGVNECWRCEELNEATARFCVRCGAPMDEEASDDHAVVQQEIGAAKVLSEGEVSTADLEAIAKDDALLAKLIEIRSDN